MSRSSVLALVTLAGLIGSLSSVRAFADESPTPGQSVSAKDGGSIEGQVVSVDYRASKFSVKSGAVTYDVVVLPSTDFQGPNNSFHGIADIKKGAHLQVMLSQRASTYTAQIVHLK